ncbi:class I SAM-dependent methyltransferase [Calothrix sp. 336/3]|uniref:class I SAM-dependent methyltransferase n=1 Tax=Calothrix sp. 336/3 TaxID=1337936 RepID=UPI000624D418|nr:class I SAM-dependent methyltransferase [Calothrix sp. 336/3]AKG23327.1 hypothetical protein IJ00_20405 [Calothrix sp. 336/3]
MMSALRRKISALKHRILLFMGLDLYLDSPDRTILEQEIIPYFRDLSEFHKILFVGCDWYTTSYKKLLKNKEYWTIEIDPKKRQYGSDKHIVDGIQNLSLHIEPGYFDLIFFNGVFGFGLNTKDDTDKAFQAYFDALRTRGVLVFGWNDISEYKPFAVLEECDNLQKFQSYTFPPLNTSHYLTPETPLRHTFDFFVKNI